MNLGVNVLGTFLFTNLLTPTLVSTTKSEPEGSVRIIWVSSLGTEMVGEKSIGLSVDDLEARIWMDQHALLYNCLFVNRVFSHEAARILWNRCGTNFPSRTDETQNLKSSI